MRSLQIVELEELPREAKKLQAIINQKRYEQKRRRRWVYLVLAGLIVCGLLYLFGLLAWFYTAVAWISAIVFVVSIFRILLQRRKQSLGL